MSIASGIAVYFLIWWIALFAVLPWGVRNAHEAGEEMVPGQANGAPVKTHLGRKLIWTTIVATALFLLHLANLHFGWLTIDQLIGD
jgi:predicted secreted protein